MNIFDIKKELNDKYEAKKYYNTLVIISQNFEKLSNISKIYYSWLLANAIDNLDVNDEEAEEIYGKDMIQFYNIIEEHNYYKTEYYPQYKHNSDKIEKDTLKHIREYLSENFTSYYDIFVKLIFLEYYITNFDEILKYFSEKKIVENYNKTKQIFNDSS